MKTLPFNSKIVLPVYLLFQLFSYRCLAIPPRTVTPKEASADVNATLVISKFEAIYQTKTGRLLSTALPTFIRASLQGDQYKWLTIVMDTTFRSNEMRFELSGNIRDLGNFYIINSQIIGIKAQGQRNKLLRKSYRIVADSMLIQVDRMSRELASILYNDISIPKQKEEIQLLIFPFVSFIKDSSLDQIGDYLTSSLFSKLETLQIIDSVKMKSKATEERQIPRQFNLILKGSFYLHEDSLKISTSMIDVKVGKELYTTIAKLDAYQLWTAPTRIANELENFLLVYPDIRDELVNLRAAKDFYEQGRKYQKEVSDANAKPKAEIMYRKAIEIDSHYIPAFIQLGDLLKSEEEYDDAISIYDEALRSDSLQVEAHLGLGEAYYYNLQSDSAIKYLEHAAELGEIQKNNRIAATANKLIGKLNSESDNYSSAINYFTQALQFEKNDVEIWYGLGNAHFLRYSQSQQQLEDTTDIYSATSYFREGMERFQDDSSFARNLTYTLFYWGKVYYDKFYSLPNDSTAFLLDEKRLFYDWASHKFTEASLILTYDNDLRAEIFNHHARLAITGKEEEKAKELSQKAVQLAPSDEWTYRLFAYLHQNDTAQINEALRSIQRALGISKSVASYQILGDIYLTKAQFDSAYSDSAYSAFEAAKNEETKISESTLIGLYRSAIVSGISERCRVVISLLKDELKSNPKKRNYVAMLSGLEGKLEQRVNIEPALKKYLQQNISRTDSVWAYLGLADIYSRTKEFEFKKSFSFISSARKISKAKVDTAEIEIALAFTYYRRGEQFYKDKDTTAALEDMSQVILHADKGYLLSTDENRKTAPLELLMSVYHDYRIDYEKSYAFSQALLSLDSLNANNRTNSVEAAFTVGHFNAAAEQAKGILDTDSLGQMPLDLEQRLAMRFVFMASKVFLRETGDAALEFRSFKKDYYKWPGRVAENLWVWRGTRRFIQDDKKDDNKIDPFYKKLLLDILNALESPEKEKGTSILEDVDKSLTLKVGNQERLKARPL